MTKQLHTFFVFLLAGVLNLPALAANDLDLLDGLGGMGGGDDILPPEQAFQLQVSHQPGALKAEWSIAEGHYLYRDKIRITTQDESVTLLPAEMSEAEKKDDPILNETLFVYHHFARVTVPYRYTGNAPAAVQFRIRYQGCSEIAGICYPPQTKTVTFDVSPATAAPADTASRSPVTAAPPVTEQDEIAQALHSGNTMLTLLVFFGAGLLLAFTPCVFPMIPILSGIIVGQGENTSTRQAFLLSLVYVLAMAATYTLVGILVGLSGENIQAWFQNPWIIGAFAAIFVALSFSMFGFYELQMPASIQSRLTVISNSQQGGTFVGAGIMGFLSALIVGPCVTAPLVGALIYIADTGDALLGGMALFSLSMGMGAPLLLIGASAGKLLPRAGAWMDAVKSVFGVLLLALAIWLLERVAPVALTMALWASLMIVSAVYMGVLEPLEKAASGWKTLWKGLGVILLVYGVILLVGLGSGSRDMLHPLKSSTAVSTQQGAATHLAFQPVKGLNGLQRALQQARAAGKPVMLDFYADWCVSCKEMETLTFSDPQVEQALRGFVLLQADVTANDERDTELYKHFGIIGPPSIMFFDTQGNERRELRVVGYMKAGDFKRHIEQVIRRSR